MLDPAIFDIVYVENRFDARRWRASLCFNAARDDSTAGVGWLSGVLGRLSVIELSPGGDVGDVTSIENEVIGLSCREYLGISGGMIFFGSAFGVDKISLGIWGGGDDVEDELETCLIALGDGFVRGVSGSVSGGAGVADAEREI